MSRERAARLSLLRVLRAASAEIISKSVWQLLLLNFESGRGGILKPELSLTRMIQVQDIRNNRLDSSSVMIDGKTLSSAGWIPPTVGAVFMWATLALACLSCFDRGLVRLLYSLPIAGTFKLKQAESLPKGYLLLLREAKKLLPEPCDERSAT